MRKSGSDCDIRLFRRIKKGDRKAFNEVFNGCYEDLCEFAFLILRQKQAAEEVVSDVLTNIWIKRKELLINTSLKSYLYRSTKNRAISHLRSKKEAVDLEEVLQTIPVSESSPEQKMISDENVNAIHWWLEAIPGKSRLIFKMSRIDKMKYREIAESLEISVKTVEKHMGKALKIIRETEIDKKRL